MCTAQTGEGYWIRLLEMVYTHLGGADIKYTV